MAKNFYQPQIIRLWYGWIHLKTPRSIEYVPLDDIGRDDSAQYLIYAVQNSNYKTLTSVFSSNFINKSFIILSMSVFTSRTFLKFDLFFNIASIS